jgi:hypothetical protein
MCGKSGWGKVFCACAVGRLFAPSHESGFFVCSSSILASGSPVNFRKKTVKMQRKLPGHVTFYGIFF